MPQAVFVCYFCRQTFTITAHHQCQKECLPITGVHLDYCDGCKAGAMEQWTEQVKKEGTT